MMYCAFKLNEIISKQICFWGGEKPVQPEKETPIERKLMVCFFFLFEEGTNPATESQLAYDIDQYNTEI